MCAVLALSVRGESQTYDEAVHLAAGYSYWKTGDYRMNPEHPPLGKLLNALPLLTLPLDDVRQAPEWQKPEGVGEFDFGHRFLYSNRMGADDLLFRARVITVVLTFCLGLILAYWTRRQFGVVAAIVTTALFS